MKVTRADSLGKLKPTLAGTAILLLVALAQSAAPQAHPAVSGNGEDIYNKQCAACHEHPDATRAPPKSTLNAMTGSAIKYALTQGNMKVQGSLLSDAERTDLIHYLTSDALNSLPRRTRGPQT